MTTALITTGEPGMTELTEVLDAAVKAATEQADAAGSDVSKIDPAIDKLAELIVVLDNARLAVAQRHRGLVEAALIAKVDPLTLYGRPFSDQWVRNVKKDLTDKGHKLPASPRGPRPRRLPGVTP
jgi:hypothetical protein